MINEKSIRKPIRNKEENLRIIQNIAKNKEGECLSDIYINDSIKLKFQCKERHQWEASPNNIKKGRWCPICRYKTVAEKRKNPNGLKEMKEIAESKGGKCLSDQYINSNTKLLFQCKNGHQWKAKSSYIKNGQWCSKCYYINMRYTPDDFKILTNEIGLELLYPSYTTTDKHYIFKCKTCGRESKKQGWSIIKKMGCIHCSHTKRGEILKNKPTHINKKTNQSFSDNVLQKSNFSLLMNQYQ